MFKKLVSLVAFFTLFIAVGQEHGTLTGTVVDASQLEEPLLFAQVSVQGTSWTTQTNFHGNFELPHLPVGRYEIAIQYLGYEAVVVPVQIKEGTTSYLKTTLKPITSDTARVQLGEVAEVVTPTEAVNPSLSKNKLP